MISFGLKFSLSAVIIADIVFIRQTLMNLLELILKLLHFISAFLFHLNHFFFELFVFFLKFFLKSSSILMTPFDFIFYDSNSTFIVFDKSIFFFLGVRSQYIELVLLLFKFNHQGIDFDLKLILLLSVYF